MATTFKFLAGKNSILLLTSVIAIGAIFFVAEYQNSNNHQVINAAATIQATRTDMSGYATKDTDGDGVPDWEETLWGLDPLTKDTGHTGVPDATKLANLITAREKSTTIGTTKTSPQKKLAPIDSLSQKFFTDYLALRKSDNLDQTNIDNLTSEVAASVASASIVSRYSTKDLKITNESTLSVQAFATAIAAIRTKYMQQYQATPIAINKDGPDFNDPAYKAGFIRASSLYKSMTIDMSKIAVPSGAASMYIDLLNAQITNAQGLYSLAIADKDPMSALQGLAKQTLASGAEATALAQVKQYIQGRGVTFGTDVVGTFWNTN